MANDHYTEGIRIAGSLKDLDGPNVNPLCHTRLYTHGRRVENALVLLHGFTNCPQQFDALGRRFFEQGWNVVIPRYPRHGHTDRLNDSISELDRKSTRLNSSHLVISYAVLCLQKKSRM